MDMVQLKEHLGAKFKPDARYIIDTHRGAKTRVSQGTGIVVGEVSDGSLNEEGTMKVVEILPAKEVKQPAPKKVAKRKGV
jgi:hypothetical protein